MKKALVVLAALGLFASPMMVSQADAAPVKTKHHTVAKHHNKQTKNHLTKRASRRHSHKATV